MLKKSTMTGHDVIVVQPMLSTEQLLDMSKKLDEFHMNMSRVTYEAWKPDTATEQETIQKAADAADVSPKLLKAVFDMESAPGYANRVAVENITTDSSGIFRGKVESAFYHAPIPKPNEVHQRLGKFMEQWAGNKAMIKRVDKTTPDTQQEFRDAVFEDTAGHLRNIGSGSMEPISPGMAAINPKLGRGLKNPIIYYPDIHPLLEEIRNCKVRPHWIWCNGELYIRGYRKVKKVKVGSSRKKKYAQKLRSLSAAKCFHVVDDLGEYI